MHVGDVLSLPWIQAIQPVRDPYRRRLSPHSDLEVWHVDIELPRWPMPPELKLRWASDEDANVRDTWRKRPLVDSLDPGWPYHCGEVELALRLRKRGLHAYWVSEWSGFPHISAWEDFCIKRSELKARCQRAWEFDHELRGTAVQPGLGRRGGHPDVVAWGEGSEHLVYLEFKGPGDKIRPKQNLWARCILELETNRLPYVAVMGTFFG